MCCNAHTGLQAEMVLTPASKLIRSHEMVLTSASAGILLLGCMWLDSYFNCWQSIAKHQMKKLAYQRRRPSSGGTGCTAVPLLAAACALATDSCCSRR